MAVYEARSVLTGIRAREVMRRDVCRVSADSDLGACIHQMTRTRASALVLDTPGRKACGVISRTDMVTAFYAGLDCRSPADQIMQPPVTCPGDLFLEDVLGLMKEKQIHRVYVAEMDSDISGVLAFSDIVGIVYRYCRDCERGGRKPERLREKSIPRLTVADVMTRGLVSARPSETVSGIIETLTVNGVGSVLICEQDNDPLGCISRTDLTLAYVRGKTLDFPAGSIMHRPVISCSPDLLLVEAIQQMLALDLPRLFVQQAPDRQVRGVLSLSDAARFRSGTCRACTASRIMAGS